MVLFRHLGSNIIVVVGHFTYDIQERWDSELLVLLSSLNTQERWLAVNIHEGLNKEVLLLVDEALAHFLECLSPRVFGLLKQLDVFTSGDLSSLFDTLARLVGAHFMAVGERIVFPGLPQEVFDHVSCGDQEDLLDLEVLKLDFLWQVA